MQRLAWLERKLRELRMRADALRALTAYCCTFHSCIRLQSTHTCVYGAVVTATGREWRSARSTKSAHELATFGWPAPLAASAATWSAGQLHYVMLTFFCWCLLLRCAHCALWLCMLSCSSPTVPAPCTQNSRPSPLEHKYLAPLSHRFRPQYAAYIDLSFV